MDCPRDDANALVTEILCRRGKHLRFRAKGHSMRPCIMSGEVIEVEPLAQRRIRLGDIIYYRGPGNSLIAHRVICEAVPQHVFTAQGDWLGLRGSGERVERKDILGVVITVRKGAWDIPLCSGPSRLFGRIWTKTRPLLMWIYDIARRVKRSLGLPVVRATVDATE